MTAHLNSRGMPLLIPPLIPPLWFVLVVILPSCTAKLSLASLPLRSERAKPSPNSTPLTAGMLKRAWERTLSRESNQGSPTPAGSPVTAVSRMPPTLSPSLAACSIASRILTAASLSRTAKPVPDRFRISSCRSINPRSGIPAHLAIWVPIMIPFPSRADRAMAPAATRAAVMRPLKCPPPR